MPGRRAASRSAGKGFAAAGERDDRHAERLAEREELLEDLLGLQPLGHGRDRAEVRVAPGAGEVPVAEVAEERDDRAAAVDASRTGPSPSTRTRSSRSSTLRVGRRKASQ